MIGRATPVCAESDIHFSNFSFPDELRELLHRDVWLYPRRIPSRGLFDDGLVGPNHSTQHFVVLEPTPDSNRYGEIRHQEKK